jgi:deoxyribonuclease V
MHIVQPELWPTELAEAMALQDKLSGQVVTEDRLDQVQHVAGVDVGFEQEGTITRAAVVVLSFPELKVVDQAVAHRPTTFPYIPGFLSFRELPAVLQALANIRVRPDLVLCDGQGLAHPRRFGIACHLGVLADVPAIGVAKTLFVGKHNEVGNERGDWQPLIHRGETVGAALRTRPGTRLIYVSSGHRISLQTTIDYVMRCTTKYRLPETTRWAHNLASDKRHRDEM